MLTSVLTSLFYAFCGFLFQDAFESPENFNADVFKRLVCLTSGGYYLQYLGLRIQQLHREVMFWNLNVLQSRQLSMMELSMLARLGRSIVRRPISVRAVGRDEVVYPIGVQPGRAS